MLYLLLSVIIVLLIAIFITVIKNSYNSKINETILDAKIDQSRGILDSKLIETKGFLENQSLKMNHEFKGVVNPISDHLKSLKEKVDEIEKHRITSFTALAEGIFSLQKETGKLKQETNNLSKALSNPGVRGKWGEIQLKRVLTMSGMQEHIDFELQSSYKTEEINIRPDAIIKMPDNKIIVIDSKTPLESYLRALDDSYNQEEHLKNHALQVKERIKELAKKNYWDKLDQLGISPDFAVLFLPAENLFASALDYDPLLIEFALDNKVLIATPTTLISLLKSISFGWRQKYLEEDSKQIVAMSKELFDRLHTMVNHFEKLGQSLGKSVDFYNDTLSSLEKRVFPSIEKLQKYSHKESERKDIKQIEKTIKNVPHR